MLMEFGGGLELAANWAQSILKSVNWTKRKGTTGKVQPSRKFLEEEKFTFERKISSITLDHDIPFVSTLFHRRDKKCSHQSSR